MAILLSVSVYAANPFLDVPNDKPVSANFRGTERGDDIGEEDVPLGCASGGNAYSEDGVGR